MPPPANDEVPPQYHHQCSSRGRTLIIAIYADVRNYDDASHSERYDEKRKPQRDPAVEAKILEISKTMGMKRRDIPDEEVQSMLFLGLINEGIKILEEGIATRPSDIDVVYGTLTTRPLRFF